eukprot:gene7075-171_t
MNVLKINSRVLWKDPAVVDHKFCSRLKWSRASGWKGANCIVISHASAATALVSNVFAVVSEWFQNVTVLVSQVSQWFQNPSDHTSSMAALIRLLLAVLVYYITRLTQVTSLPESPPAPPGAHLSIPITIIISAPSMDGRFQCWGAQIILTFDVANGDDADTVFHILDDRIYGAVFASQTPCNSTVIVATPDTSTVQTCSTQPKFAIKYLKVVSLSKIEIGLNDFYYRGVTIKAPTAFMDREITTEFVERFLCPALLNGVTNVLNDLGYEYTIDYNANLECIINDGVFSQAIYYKLEFVMAGKVWLDLFDFIIRPTSFSRLVANSFILCGSSLRIYDAPPASAVLVLKYPLNSPALVESGTYFPTCIHRIETESEAYPYLRPEHG